MKGSKTPSNGIADGKTSKVVVLERKNQLFLCIEDSNQHFILFAKNVTCHVS